jgi:hypothetical protein
MQFKLLCNEKVHDSYTSLGIVSLICSWVTHDVFQLDGLHSTNGRMVV